MAPLFLVWWAYHVLFTWKSIHDMILVLTMNHMFTTSSNVFIDHLLELLFTSPASVAVIPTLPPFPSSHHSAWQYCNQTVGERSRSVEESKPPPHHQARGGFWDAKGMQCPSSTNVVLAPFQVMYNHWAQKPVLLGVHVLNASHHWNSMESLCTY